MFQSPSQTFNLSQWLNSELDESDWWLLNWWVCYQFDSAVIHFGLWVESQLSELDDKGKPKHTLNELVGDGRRASAIPKRLLEQAVEVIQVD